MSRWSLLHVRSLDAPGFFHSERAYPLISLSWVTFPAELVKASSAIDAAEHAHELVGVARLLESHRYPEGHPIERVAVPQARFFRALWKFIGDIGFQTE